MHIAIEIPVAIQGLWAPSQLPFLELNNTTLIMLKVRPNAKALKDLEPHHVMGQLLSSLSLGSCVLAFLCYSLPGKFILYLTSGIDTNMCFIEFMPGKRAVAIGLTVYNCIASTVLFQAPRFIPMSLGTLAEA